MQGSKSRLKRYIFFLFAFLMFSPSFSWAQTSIYQNLNLPGFRPDFDIGVLGNDFYFPVAGKV